MRLPSLLLPSLARSQMLIAIDLVRAGEAADRNEGREREERGKIKISPAAAKCAPESYRQCFVPQIYEPWKAAGRTA